MKRFFLLLILVIFPFLPGCATVETLNFGYPAPLSKSVEEEFPYQDFQGVLHVHSRYSETSEGYFDEIGRAAQKTHADFVIVSDHNTLKPLREKMEGFYGPVLILVGTELVTREGHLLVLGIERELDWETPLEENLMKIREQGGLSFVAHGALERSPWLDWDLAPLTGMEVYTFAEDFSRPPEPWLMTKAMFLPPRAFFKSALREPVENLRRWDSILKKRKFVAVGSTDAHQKIRFLGHPVDDYGPMFSVVQTHVWAEDLSKEAILEALRKGRAYIAFGIRAPCRNFLFTAEGSREKAMMGDTIGFESGLKLKIISPKTARIRLLRDGVLLQEAEGNRLETEAPESGIYRAEVYWEGKLWILSNPIYIKP